MHEYWKKLWPLLVGLLIFIGVSAFVKSHTDIFANLLNESSHLWGMVLYVLLGIATVMIPFGSLVPFVPIAVTLWGWEITAFLTFASWVLGSQILFEFARGFGKPFVTKFIPENHINSIKGLVQGKSLLHQIMVRLFTHGDIVSYAFGLFTHVNRWEFLIITAIGVAPGAIMAAYVGALELKYQIGMAACGIGLLALYWFLEWKRPEWLRAVRLLPAA